MTDFSMWECVCISTGEVFFANTIEDAISYKKTGLFRVNKIRSTNMQKNHRANVWITPETREQLIAIGRAHGAAEGREASPGIRVAARYHGRLVEALEKCISGWEKSEDVFGPMQEARLLLREIEVAG